MSVILLLHHGPDSILTTLPPLWIFVPAAVAFVANLIRTAREGLR